MRWAELRGEIEVDRRGSMAPGFVFDQHDQRSYRSVAIELLHDRRLPRESETHEPTG